MKSKLLIIIANNITAADVTNINDISYLSFDGNKSMSITDNNSILNAINHIKDFYSVDCFEKDMDIMIVYDKISSEIIKYLSESFSGCDRLGIVPFESIALIIVRNKNIALPVEVVFDGIVHAFGEKDSDELTRLSIVLNDLIFLYYSNEVHFDSVSKSEIIELRNQVDFYRSKYEDLYVQISDLKKELTIKNYEITKKNDELSKMKIYK